MMMPRMMSALMTPGAPRATENPAKTSQSPRAKVIQPKTLIATPPRDPCIAAASCRAIRRKFESGLRLKSKRRLCRSSGLDAIPAASFGPIQRMVRHPDELLEITFLLLGRIEGRNPDRDSNAAPAAPSGASVGDTDDEPLRRGKSRFRRGIERDDRELV